MGISTFAHLLTDQEMALLKHIPEGARDSVCKALIKHLCARPFVQDLDGMDGDAEVQQVGVDVARVLVDLLASEESLGDMCASNSTGRRVSLATQSQFGMARRRALPLGPMSTPERMQESTSRPRCGDRDTHATTHHRPHTTHHIPRTTHHTPHTTHHTPYTTHHTPHHTTHTTHTQHIQQHSQHTHTHTTPHFRAWN
jgi:hypothetical protein